jgi:hypothetical protein
MPRRKPLQTNFSAGELAPDLRGRLDTEQYQNGAKSLLNRRCLIGGGTKRRPGSWHEAELVGGSRIEAFIVDAVTSYILVFSSGRMDAYSVNATTGRLTAAGSVTSAPWTGTIWRDMDYAQAANTAFLTHVTMAPQTLVRTGASTWTRSAQTFFTGIGGRLEQPYFKVAAEAVTLTPSALTGSITVTASAAVFTAAHVGTRIRILQREITITGFTSSTVVTGTVIEALRPTYLVDVSVVGTQGYAVGEVVEGSSTGRKGIVTSIVSAAELAVVMTSTLDNFDATTDFLVGPNSKVDIGGSVLHTNAAVKDWDEQLFTSFNGYPACVTLHRNRLLFGGHPVVPNALIGSKNTNLYSFDVGDASDGDGIFETIGDAGASSIVQLHSAEQLLVFTDLGPYYVPENATSPFRPTSIAFFPFGSPWSITAALEPKTFDDGVLFGSKSLIIKARPTGDQGRSWLADEVSLLSSHIVDNPADMAVVSNFANGSERYAALVNDDGTIVALQLVEAQKIRNMTPWTTAGAYTSVAAVGSFLYATVERTINGSLRYFLEFFDDNLTLDLVTEYATQAAMDAGVPIRYGSTTVNVVTSDLAYHLGEYPPTLSTLPAGPYQVGLYYDSVTELLPPALDDNEGAHAGEMMRICQAYVQVLQSARFEANGHELSAYAVTDPVDIAPPRRNGWQQFDLLGWAVEPTIAIRQPDPLPLDLLAVKTIVAY